MSPIVTTATVGPDGTLTLALPAETAGRPVRVTVESAKPTMTQAEWAAAVLATAGGWQGDFERPPQGEPEERDPL